jgi:hypothetical protein
MKSEGTTGCAVGRAASGKRRVPKRGDVCFKPLLSSEAIAKPRARFCPLSPLAGGGQVGGQRRLIGARQWRKRCSPHPNPSPASGERLMQRPRCRLEPRNRADARAARRGKPPPPNLPLRCAKGEEQDTATAQHRQSAFLLPPLRSRGGLGRGCWRCAHTQKKEDANLLYRLRGREPCRPRPSNPSSARDERSRKGARRRRVASA